MGGGAFRACPDPPIKIIIFIVFIAVNDAWHLWEVGDVSLKCFKCGVCQHELWSLPPASEPGSLAPWLHVLGHTGCFISPCPVSSPVKWG